MSESRIYLIDASIYIFRAYFSLPENWHAHNGLPTQAVTGYCGFLLDLLERQQPRYGVAAFDESLGGCFRHQIFPGYKRRRELPDEALAFQLTACKQITELLGIETVASPRFEADDLIAALARRAREKGLATVVVSRDKDLGQLLVGELDQLWDPSYAEPIDRVRYQSMHGIRPEQVADFLALVGDSVDDIPGVPGIGAKTATALLGIYDGVEAMLAQLDTIAASTQRSASRIASALAGHAEQLRMVLQLTRLADHALDDMPPVRLRTRTPDIDALQAFAEYHGLSNRMRERLARLARRVA